MGLIRNVEAVDFNCSSDTFGLIAVTKAVVFSLDRQGESTLAGKAWTLR